MAKANGKILSMLHIEHMLGKHKMFHHVDSIPLTAVLICYSLYIISYKHSGVMYNLLNKCAVKMSMFGFFYLELLDFKIT